MESLKKFSAAVKVDVSGKPLAIVLQLDMEHVFSPNLSTPSLNNSVFPRGIPLVAIIQQWPDNIPRNAQIMQHIGSQLNKQVRTFWVENYSPKQEKIITVHRVVIASLDNNFQLMLSDKNGLAFDLDLYSLSDYVNRGVNMIPLICQITELDQATAWLKSFNQVEKLDAGFYAQAAINAALKQSFGNDSLADKWRIGVTKVHFPPGANV